MIFTDTLFHVKVYVAFVGGPTMFLHLPLTTFGDIQVPTVPVIPIIVNYKGLVY
jgi:hypothetical protein